MGSRWEVVKSPMGAPRTRREDRRLCAGGYEGDKIVGHWLQGLRVGLKGARSLVELLQ